MDQERTTISPIIDYPTNSNGSLVTGRKGLLNRRPSLDAPPAIQPGSVDWTVMNMFGDIEKGVQMIESLVAGQGSQADERWIKFCLLYREWELRWRKGEYPDKPTLNQVCWSLDFDAKTFLVGMQREIQTTMSTIGHLRAALQIPAIVDKVVEVALSDEGDTKDRELALKLGGMIEEKSGVQVNVQQNNQVVLKGDKERMKTPLLQFSETVEAIDVEVRNNNE